MISYNRKHAEDDLSDPEYDDLDGNMPEDFKADLKGMSRTRRGKAALKGYSEFWGIPYPTQFKEVSIPGSYNGPLIGLGRTPKAFIANGPKGKATKVEEILGPFTVVRKPGEHRLMLLSGRNSNARKRKLKFLGWATETHYVPPDAVEDAGSFKSGKYWIHKHDDEGGTYPKVWRDQAGNLIYGKSTLTVTDWMRR